MSNQTSTDSPALPPVELDGDALAGVQGGTAAAASAMLKGDTSTNASTAEAKPKPHTGGVNVLLADGSVR